MDETKLQEELGYTFSNPDLLHHALTHSSYANEQSMGSLASNERLEFLGDAVLELCSSEVLYAAYPEKAEGALTTLRASLVCERSLAETARSLELGSLLLLSRGERNEGGALRDSILSDAVEAIIGAMYLDGGIEPCRRFIASRILCDMERKQRFYDSKTHLQEIIQAEPGHVLEYRLVKEEGPDHRKRYTMEACLDGTPIGRGEGTSKKSAQQAAAYEALTALEKINPAIGSKGTGCI